MTLSRRQFHRLALQSAAASVFALARQPFTFAQQLPVVPFQPFAAAVQRLLAALAALGTPLDANALGALRDALTSSAGADEAHAVQAIVKLLAPMVLMEVELNPEMRVAVHRGAAPAVLYQHGWRSFLVKVTNDAGTTPTLVFKSPQAAPVGRHSSLAVMGVHDFTNGAVDLVESRARWIAIETPSAPPLTPALSGLALEYRILQLYSRDAGQREATLLADAGWGEQDLGFRSSLPVLFRCLPAHKIHLQIQDENGKASIASLTITDIVGRVYPPQTKREMPDLNFQPNIYRYNGESVLLPPGDYDLQYTRGPEYVSQKLSIRVTAAPSAPLCLKLQRWITPSDYGYYSGDTHIHAAGCSHYESPTEGVTPVVMERQVDGEALDLGAVLNWAPGFEYQKQFFSGHALAMHHAHSAHAAMHDPAPEAGMPHDPADIAAAEESAIDVRLQNSADAPGVVSLLRYDVEVSGFPSSHCGHLVLLQLKDFQFPGTTSIDSWPSWNLPIVRWAKAQGATVGYAHAGHGMVVNTTALPNFVIPPFDSCGTNEFLVDITHPGTVDFLSGCDLWPFAELNAWYHTLNCGFSTTFAGETDFPCLTDVCVGGGRSYVPLSAAPQGDKGYAAWLEAFLHNSSYFGDGRSHIFNLRVNGVARSKDPHALDAQGADVEITAQVCARLESTPTPDTRTIQHASPYEKPYWHLERARLGETRTVPVELIVNGSPVDHTNLLADSSVQTVAFRTRLRRSSWVALRIYPSSHTNPIFLEIDHKPVRASKASAQWCRQSLEALWQQKQQRIRPAELKAAAAAYDHARTTYDRIITECLT